MYGLSLSGGDSILESTGRKLFRVCHDILFDEVDLISFVFPKTGEKRRWNGATRGPLKGTLES